MRSTYLIRLAVIGAALLSWPTSPALAVLTRFDDREAFLLQAQTGLALETFDQFTARVDFTDAPLTIGRQTYEVTGQRPPGFGRISQLDVEAGLNGTSHLVANTHRSGTLRIAFAAPITMWGADFRDFGNSAAFPSRRSDILVNGELLGVPADPVNHIAGFIGVVSTRPFTSLEFVYVANDAAADGFGMDDVLIGGAVPESASWAMMIAGFALAGAATRRRRTGPLLTCTSSC